jgi:O-antigen/teichoic acid export membrane protein
MPATIIIILGQFITHPVLNDLARSYHENKRRDFIGLIRRLILIVLGVTLLALVLAYFLGIPVLELLFTINLDAHRNHLLLALAGASFYTIAVIISVALITMRHTAIQLVIYLLMTAVSLPMSLLLINQYQLAGGFLSYSLTMLFGMFCYLAVFLFSLRRMQPKS